MEGDGKLGKKNEIMMDQRNSTMGWESKDIVWNFREIRHDW